MARNVLVDAGFLVALLNERDSHRPWATAQARQFHPPWRTCEAVLSEAFHLLGSRGGPALIEVLLRATAVPAFDLAANLSSVLRLLDKYADVPISLSDACLVRMTEVFEDPVLLTTDSDFRIYRRNGRQIVPCVLPDTTR